MNEIFLWFWLADFVESLSILAFVCSLAAIMIFLFSFIEYEYEPEKLNRGKKIAALLAIPVMLSIFLPNSSTLKLLAIGKAGKLAATETELGKKSVQALEAILNDIIEKRSKK